MYNRYIPQPDGSFRRNTAQDKSPAPPDTFVCPSREPEPFCPEPGHSEYPATKPAGCGQGIGAFFRNLLPKGFDTADLLIVLLLLLMAGDSPEDQNSALLTLAIYLFL
jgi:hypothetical protein